MKQRRLTRDLERFATLWISNPAARLEFARLVSRVSKLNSSTISTMGEQLREWVREEERSAKAIGVTLK